MIRNLFIAGSLVLLSSASNAYAQCDCIGQRTEFNRGSTFATAYEELVAADLVFYGQVVATTKVANNVGDPSKRNYEVEVFVSVERAWKKDTPNIVTLRQSIDGCILDFNIGDRWLIYGYYDKDGYLRTAVCSRSRTADRKPELDMGEFHNRGVKESAIRKLRENMIITVPAS